MLSLPDIREQLLRLPQDQRRDLVTALLWSLPRDEVQAIHSRLSDLMQKEIVGLLPPELSTRILSHLDVDELLQFRLVSRTWAKLCDDQAVWKAVCLKHTRPIVPARTTWSDVALHRQMQSSRAAPAQTRTFADESFDYGDDDDSSHITMSASPSTARPSAVQRTVWERPTGGLPTYQRAVAFPYPPSPQVTDTNADQPPILSYLDLPTPTPRVNYKHLCLVRRTLLRRMTYTRPADLEAGGRRSASTWNPRVTIVKPTTSQEHGGLPGHNESIYSLHLVRHHMSISCTIGEIDDALYALRTLQASDMLGGLGTPSRLGMASSPGRAPTPASFSVSGRDWLLTASRDRTLRLWQLGAIPRVVKIFAGGHTGSILTHFVAEIPVEPDVSKASARSRTRSPTKSPTPMPDAPATRLVAISGGGDGRICLWDIEHGNGTPERIVEAHSDSVFFVRGDDERVVSCSKDRTIRVFDIRTLDELLVIDAGGEDGHRGAINTVGLTKEFIVSASGDRYIKVWDIHNGRLLATLEAHVRGISSIAFEADPNVAASGWEPVVPGSILRATLVTGSSDASIKTFHIVQLPSSSSAELDEVTFRDMLDLDDNGAPRVRYAIDPGVEYRATCACAVPTRPSPAGCMRCFNRGHTDLVRSLHVVDDITLSASYDKTIKMWDRLTGRLIFDFSGCHAGSVFAITGDRTRVASSGIDARIAIIDFADGLDTSFV